MFSVVLNYTLKGIMHLKRSYQTSNLCPDVLPFTGIYLAAQIFVASIKKLPLRTKTAF